MKGHSGNLTILMLLNKKYIRPCTGFTVVIQMPDGKAVGKNTLYFFARIVRIFLAFSLKTLCDQPL